MQVLPRINGRYWLTLAAASIFGTNTGDYLSDALSLGHLVGLPFIALALASVFVADRFSPWRTAIFFWVAIIVIRTGATNVGDAFHDYHIGFGISIPLVLLCFAASVWLYHRRWSRSGATGSVGVDPVFWLTMILAGILGTVGGDAASFRLGLLPPGTALVFFALAALVIVVWGRRARLTEPVRYWVTLAMIRTGGTGAGDALAHAFGLPVATITTGTAFVAMVVYFYAIERQSEVAATTPADAST